VIGIRLVTTSFFPGTAKKTRNSMRIISNTAMDRINNLGVAIEKKGSAGVPMLLSGSYHPHQ
jgi:hypothetical protein